MTSTIVIGIASIILALVFRAQTGDYPPAAQRMPTLLIWVIVGLAAMMIAEELYKRRKLKNHSSRVSTDAPVEINWPVLVSFSAAIVAYVALIPIAGYLVVTPLFVGGALITSKSVRLMTAIYMAVGTTVFMWAIFVWALSLPVKLLPFAH